MPVSNQYTIDGQMIGYHDGSARKDFLTDHLGSVTAEIAQNGTTRTFDGRYKAMGGNLWSVGTRGSFGWVGTWGYRTTGLTAASHYVRARHYAQQGTQWTTVDPLWPYEASYQSRGQRLTLLIDPSGKFPEWIGCGGGDNMGLSDCCKGLNKLNDSKIRDQIKSCMAKGNPSYTNTTTIDWFLSLLRDRCTKGGIGNKVCVRCVGKDNVIPFWNEDCPNPCKGGFWGYTFPDGQGDSLPKDQCGLINIGNEDCPSANFDQNRQPCKCSIIMCDAGFHTGGLQSPCAVFYHELSHCSGLGHPKPEPPRKGDRNPRELDFIYKLACCVCRAVNPDGLCGSECEGMQQ